MTKNERKKSPRQIAGWIFWLLQALATALAIYILIRFPVLPTKYFVAFAAVSLVFLGISGYLLTTKKGKKRFYFGIVFSIAVTAFFVVAFLYLEKTRSTLDNISGADQNDLLVEEMAVLVLVDDPALSVADTVQYPYGIQNSTDYANSLAVIEYINKQYSCTLDVRAYETYSELAAALLAGEVQAIILDNAFVSLLQEYEEGFESATRVLEELSFSAQMPKLSITPTPTPTPTPEPTLPPDVSPTPTPTPTESVTPTPIVMPPRNGKEDVTGNYFTVYFSGIDTYGSINTRSRSDVNIVMTVNPLTKKILLVTIPRDAYVTIPGISGGSYDKLTHAGIYGVSASMRTLEQVYGIKLDYYVRVNFSSVEKFVDLLGGVNVYSAYEFTSSHIGVHFNKGYNLMNGREALAFARERYAFASGDNQRGKNQMELIKAVFNKMRSPSMLLKFSDIMNAVSSNFQTDLTMDQLTSLVRMQLNDGASWTIETYAVTTTGGSAYCYSYHGRKLYVGYINQSSAAEAGRRMRAVMEGK